MDPKSHDIDEHWYGGRIDDLFIRSKYLVSAFFLSVITILGFILCPPFFLQAQCFLKWAKVLLTLPFMEPAVLSSTTIAFSNATVF